MTRPEVVVLLATYNGEEFLHDQIRSLARQAGVRVALWMSDDNLSDQTVEIARRAAAQEGIHLTELPARAPAGGAAGNFFRLLAEADLSRCEYLAFADQDDVWLAGKLERAVELLGTSAADGYSCNSIAFWPDRHEVRIRKDYPFTRWDYLFESASHGCTYVLTGATARDLQRVVRERARALGKIDFHDWFISAWVRHRGGKWVCDDRFLIRYRQTGRNALGANAGLGQPSAACGNWLMAGTVSRPLRSQMP